MKYLIASIILVGMSGVSFSADLWSDASKNHVVTGTPSVHSGSFIVMTEREAADYAEAKQAYSIVPAEIFKEIRDKQTKSYWLYKAFAHQQSYDTYMSLHRIYGFDVSVSTNAEAAKIAKYKARYDAIP